jgi:hypothetical protein
MRRFCPIMGDEPNGGSTTQTHTLPSQHPPPPLERRMPWVRRVNPLARRTIFCASRAYVPSAADDDMGAVSQEQWCCRYTTETISCDCRALDRNITAGDILDHLSPTTLQVVRDNCADQAKGTGGSFSEFRRAPVILRTKMITTKRSPQKQASISAQLKWL